MYNMTDKQLKIQEAIMIAIHWDLEKARKIELLLKWSKCFLNTYNEYATFIWWRKMITDCDKQLIRVFDPDLYNYTIIWLPPTLSRVLTTLGDDFESCFIVNHKDYKNWQWINIFSEDHAIHWKLLNEDWSDSTLFDQSEKTQDAVYNLLIS